MQLEFLGTGTSTGVPLIGCGCDVCRSSDPRDKRLRASAIVRTGDLNILIDCGPDFRTQMLRASDTQLDALIVTHSHYDHVGGIDDLRPYCAATGEFPVYCQDDVAADLRARVPYCFREHPYPGAPRFELIPIVAYRSFQVGDVTIEPLRVMHAKLPIIGFKIGKLGYITDAKTLPDATIDALRGIDTLVINALRLEEHFSHFNLEESLAMVAEIKPRRAFLTHMSHDMPRMATMEVRLPANVQFAYDRMIIEI